MTKLKTVEFICPNCGESTILVDEKEIGYCNKCNQLMSLYKQEKSQSPVPIKIPHNASSSNSSKETE